MDWVYSIYLPTTHAFQDILAGLHILIALFYIFSSLLSLFSAPPPPSLPSHICSPLFVPFLMPSPLCPLLSTLASLFPPRYTLLSALPSLFCLLCSLLSVLPSLPSPFWSFLLYPLWLLIFTLLSRLYPSPPSSLFSPMFPPPCLLLSALSALPSPLCCLLVVSLFSALSPLCSLLCFRLSAISSLLSYVLSLLYPPLSHLLFCLLNFVWPLPESLFSRVEPNWSQMQRLT